MRSKAHFKSHPLHPILIAFPIAFLSGALAFDLAGWAAGWRDGWMVGSFLNLAGIVTGLVAAVPGLVDYFYVVPPKSSAKARATRHMLVNSAALAAFGLSWIFRDTGAQPGVGTLLLEAIGAALLTSGGWLGGTLVYRNQIGVDHRYAEAGKWREGWVDARPGEPVTLAKADELEVNQLKLVHVADRRIALARTEQGYAACDDRCSHKGGPLADGVLICGTVSCPWHGSQFDVHTGAVKAGPAKEPIASYRVEESGGEVRLLDEGNPTGW